ncbi:MAG: rhamnulokinase [Roseburia sp.]|nr:rhamnulokinase [Anaeroplasma bactoclasticum]MCM1195551.1 rhamnulokinase [Roseburia sp.]MCM1555966.1 rhamnulokinase [Anaeroplasma bactoclasticum]
MKYYLAIDIGASSGRHILGWLEDGILKTEEIYRFSNQMETKNNHLVWNTKKIFNEIKNGLKQLKIIGKIPAYIGIDTWAVDYALLDGKNTLIGDVYAYRDIRCEKTLDKVQKRISFEACYERTGIQYQPFNTLYQLYEDKLSGKLENAKSMLMLPDYFNFLLTGVKKQEYTNATSTGLVNAYTHTWDKEILEKLGFNKDLFLELSQPGELVGELKEEIQAEIGYNAKVILPATHDTASAVLASPMESSNPYISSGTWSLLGVEQEICKTDHASLNANYSNEGSIDNQFRYQKNIMGLWLLQNVRHELGDISFPELANMARNHSFIGRIDVNHSRFLAPQNMMEEIRKAIGAPLKNSEVVKVIYDSLAESYKIALEELERNTGKTYNKLHIFGGGCQDKYLNELTSKVTHKMLVVGPVEATSIGNLMMQMIGTKEIESLSIARQIIKKSFDISEVKYE